MPLHWPSLWHEVGSEHRSRRRVLHRNPKFDPKKRTKSLRVTAENWKWVKGSSVEKKCESENGRTGCWSVNFLGNSIKIVNVLSAKLSSSGLGRKLNKKAKQSLKIATPQLDQLDRQLVSVVLISVVSVTIDHNTSTGTSGSKLWFACLSVRFELLIGFESSIGLNLLFEPSMKLELAVGSRRILNWLDWLMICFKHLET